MFVDRIMSFMLHSPCVDVYVSLNRARSILKCVRYRDGLLKKKKQKIFSGVSHSTHERFTVHSEEEAKEYEEEKKINFTFKDSQINKIRSFDVLLWIFDSSPFLLYVAE